METNQTWAAGGLLPTSDLIMKTIDKSMQNISHW